MRARRAVQGRIAHDRVPDLGNAEMVGVAAQSELIQTSVDEQTAFDQTPTDPADHLRSHAELAGQAVDADRGARGPHHNLETGLLLGQPVELEAPGTIGPRSGRRRARRRSRRPAGPRTRTIRPQEKDPARSPGIERCFHATSRSEIWRMPSSTETRRIAAAAAPTAAEENAMPGARGAAE